MKNKKIKVGVSCMPPMVIKTKNKFLGFEVELWKKIASDLGLECSYEKYCFKDLLSAVKNKEVDVGIGAITRTEEREICMDFSYETLDSSLSILISKKHQSLGRSFLSFVRRSYKRVLLFIALIFVVILIIGNGIWFLEKQDGVFDSSYSKGIFESVWWAFITMTGIGYSSYVPQTVAGKIMAIFLMLSGLSLFGLLSAVLVSFFTSTKVKYNIDSPKDLVGKKVATQRHTLAVGELKKMELRIAKMAEMDAACRLLKKHKVDAVVFDTPALLNYIKKARDKNLVLVAQFVPQKYSFAFPDKSPLRELVNRKLLKLRETGEYDSIYQKWF